MMKENSNVKLNTNDMMDLAIETGMQLIPIVGGSLATIYFGIKQTKEFKRIEQFYTELANDLQKQSERIVNLETQYQNGLVSLIEQLNNKVEKEHQYHKVQLYKTYMKNLLFNPITEQNYDQRKTFLDVLESLTFLELEILVFLYDNQGMGPIAVKSFGKSGVSQYALVGGVSKLKMNGLVSAVTNNIVFGGDNSLEEMVSVTDYGLEFINFCIVE